MRLSLSSLALACATLPLVSAAPPKPQPSLAPNLPASAFETTPFHALPVDEILAGPRSRLSKPEPKAPAFQVFATCGNPRVRIEWDHASADQRRNFVNAIRCLIDKPRSGQFANARNRYEDLVALHQQLTPNVHGNHKFLIWHRYYLWVFEDMLRAECGYNAGILWFDESRYAGRFRDSSIFSNEYFGGINVGGQCVTNGRFAGLTLNIGPGTGNTPHCLSRNEDTSLTYNTRSEIVQGCNNWGGYADMARCSELGAHSYGHNGVGSVMRDMYSSPGDPFFFMHHAFIDRNYRVWQNANAARVTYIDGADRVGNPLTMDTTISVNNMRPTVRVRDIINTMDTTLCYKYNY